MNGIGYKVRTTDFNELTEIPLNDNSHKKNNNKNNKMYSPDDDDNLVRTAEIIYETYRRRTFEGKLRTYIILILSSFLTIAVLITIGFLQYDEYFAYVNQREDYINKTKQFCFSSQLANIDEISTPIAFVLIVLYIIIYKRRVFLRDKFKYRNIGLPMIVSCWNKTTRFYTSFVYGLIAFNIFKIVRSSLSGSDDASTFVKSNQINDPTGLLKLLIRVLEMFLIGLRYYPMLVAYRANFFTITLTAAIYMWIDFINNIYRYGKCESISSEFDGDVKEAQRRLSYYLVYKVLSSIPFSIFSSFILISLTYKSIITLFDYILLNQSFVTRSRLIEKSKDSFCCPLCNVNDDDELFYSKYDIQYVCDLLEKNNNDDDGQENDDNKMGNLKKSDIKLLNKNLKYVKVKKSKEPFYIKIMNKIYKWDSTFRFTSRFTNTIVVAIVALYYFFIYLSYTIVIQLTYLLAHVPDEILVEKINIGDLLCDSDDTCIEALQNIGPISLPLPKKTLKFLPSLKSSVLAVVIVPLFGALLITLIQLLFVLKDTKTHLIELYKGKCEFVKKAKNLSNPSIASASFHFGGYVVGYLVWGYFIIYIFLVLIGIGILIIRLFIGDQTFGQIGYKIIPVVCAIIVKKIVNTVASKYTFLNRKSNILALNNFRAFNVFLYFNFYFDCFMGVISAIIRIIKALIAAILMMPRISYSFLGRHLERSDNGYACYSGFLHMEATHTNPIIISFCSLLYYKPLGEYIKRHKQEKLTILENEEKLKNELFQIKKYNGRLSVVGPAAATTANQNEILKQKSHSIPQDTHKKKNKIEKESIFSKIKACCNKNKDETVRTKF